MADRQRLPDPQRNPRGARVAVGAGLATIAALPNRRRHGGSAHVAGAARLHRPVRRQPRTRRDRALPRRIPTPGPAGPGRTVDGAGAGARRSDRRAHGLRDHHRAPARSLLARRILGRTPDRRRRALARRHAGQRRRDGAYGILHLAGVRGRVLPPAGRQAPVAETRAQLRRGAARTARHQRRQGDRRRGPRAGRRPGVDRQPHQQPAPDRRDQLVGTDRTRGRGGPHPRAGSRRRLRGHGLPDPRTLPARDRIAGDAQRTGRARGRAPRGRTGASRARSRGRSAPAPCRLPPDR